MNQQNSNSPYFLLNAVGLAVIIAILIIAIYIEDKDKNKEPEPRTLIKLKRVEVIKEVPVLPKEEEPKRGYEFIKVEISKILKSRIDKLAKEKSITTELATIKILKKGSSQKKKRLKKSNKIRKVIKKNV